MATRKKRSQRTTEISTAVLPKAKLQVASVSEPLSLLGARASSGVQVKRSNTQLAILRHVRFHQHKLLEGPSADVCTSLEVIVSSSENAFSKQIFGDHLSPKS